MINNLIAIFFVTHCKLVDYNINNCLSIAYNDYFSHNKHIYYVIIGSECILTMIKHIKGEEFLFERKNLFNIFFGEEYFKKILSILFIK